VQLRFLNPAVQGSHVVDAVWAREEGHHPVFLQSSCVVLGTRYINLSHFVKEFRIEIRKSIDDGRKGGQVARHHKTRSNSTAGYNEDMLYSISGKLASKNEGFAVVDAAGLGLKVFTNSHTLEKLPKSGSEVKFFSHLHVREDALELYGFLTGEELRLFELLISVSGVGPKSAIAILNVADLKDLSAAIKENRPDLLTRASGIGRKTAERIVLELRGKVEAPLAGMTVQKMESDADLVETLVGLGYRREEAKSALARVDEKTTDLEERLKAALKILGRK